MTEPVRVIDGPKVLLEVREVSDDAVTGWVRDAKGGIYEITLPRFMCFEDGCIPGGSFYFQAQSVDLIEEQKELDELFKDL